jgi:dTDP-4-amino-4,6-dideoxygalactose transaminase
MALFSSAQHMRNRPHTRPHICVSDPALDALDDVENIARDIAGAISSTGCGIGRGDVVFVSTFAHEGVAEAITSCGAEPIFIDVTLESWHVSAEVLDLAVQWCHSVGKNPKAMLMVDVYGRSIDADDLRDICWKYDMALIENYLARKRRMYMETLPEMIRRRHEINMRYHQGLEETSGIRFMPAGDPARDTAGSTCAVFEDFDMGDRVLACLAAKGIESQKLWKPLHTLAPYENTTAIVDGTAEYLHEHGLCLPSSSTLTDSQVDEVIEAVLAVLG